MTGPRPFDPQRLLRVLGAHGVEHVLIGGLAAALHGSPTTTNDADICPRPTSANFTRLARALVDLDARIRTDGEPEGLTFDRSGTFLASVALLNLVTDAGDLDIAVRPSGTAGYDELVRSAVTYELDETTVLVASLDDIIHSKESADRPRDRAVLPVLRALRDEIS